MPEIEASTNLISTDTTARNARWLRFLLVAWLIEIPCCSPRRLDWGLWLIAPLPSARRAVSLVASFLLYVEVARADRLAVDDPKLREQYG